MVIPLQRPTDAPGFDKMTCYNSSSTFSRYFCPTCGASVLNVEAGEWEFPTGIVEFSMEGGNPFGLVEGGLLNRGLLFIGDTLDGGAASWVNAGKVEGLACRKMGHRDSQDVTDAMLIGMSQYSLQISPPRPPKLQGSCHCGDVRLELVPSDEKVRYDASLCACTSCSKTCGFEITSWVRVPKDKVRMADGRSFVEGQKDLAFYSSSSNVERYFCRRCGATISYARKGQDTVDVPPGLFNAAEGSRAELWFHWNKDGDNVSYHEDALDQKFVAALIEGTREATK
jgi:hypothetical protein